MQHPLREVVFEMSSAPASSTGRSGWDAATAALLDLPGIQEAHVDRHGTWAMVSFDPAIATVAVITGCLCAHGLHASRMRNLHDPPDQIAGPPTSPD